MTDLKRIGNWGRAASLESRKSSIDMDERDAEAGGVLGDLAQQRSPGMVAQRPPAVGPGIMAIPALLEGGNEVEEDVLKRQREKLGLMTAYSSVPYSIGEDTPAASPPQRTHKTLATVNDESSSDHGLLQSPPGGQGQPKYYGSLGTDVPGDHSRQDHESLERREAAFKLKLKKQAKRELLYEIRADDTAEMREMTIRELYQYIQVCTASVVSVVPPDMSPVPRRQMAASKGSSGSVQSQAAPAPRPSGGGGAYVPSNYLHNRDLRQLASTSATSEPSIIVRRGVILMNFETLRTIILVDRILLFVDDGVDSLLTDMQRAVSEEHEDVPEYEMKAIEAVLAVSSRLLNKQVELIEPRVRTIVATMEGPGNAATSTQYNESFRKITNEVAELDTRVKARRRAILQVLEEDEDLALMNLTKIQENPGNYEPPLAPDVLEDHEEVELLLEAFLQEINSRTNVLERMRQKLQNTEALIQVKLDIARNRLLTATTIFTLASMSAAFGTFVSGIFGMNLNSNVQDSPHWFTTVSVCASGLMILSTVGITLYLNKLGVLVS